MPAQPVGPPGDLLTQAHRAAEAINASTRSGTTTIVAFDGPGGSGKSTLATLTANLLGAPPLIAGDDFYRVMPENDREHLTPEQGYDQYFDWQRLRDEVLIPLRAGDQARYRRYSWETHNLADQHKVSPGRQSRRSPTPARQPDHRPGGGLPTPALHPDPSKQDRPTLDPRRRSARIGQ